MPDLVIAESRDSLGPPTCRRLAEFPQHGAAEALEAIAVIDVTMLVPHMRAKLSEFWEAAEQIVRRLITYWRKRQWRKFLRLVVILQAHLRMLLAVHRFVSIPRLKPGFLVHRTELVT